MCMKWRVECVCMRLRMHVRGFELISKVGSGERSRLEGLIFFCDDDARRACTMPKGVHFSLLIGAMGKSQFKFPIFHRVYLQTTTRLFPICPRMFYIQQFHVWYWLLYCYINTNMARVPSDSRSLDNSVELQLCFFVDSQIDAVVLLATVDKYNVWILMDESTPLSEL